MKFLAINPNIMSHQIKTFRSAKFEQISNSFEDVFAKRYEVILRDFKTNLNLMEYQQRAFGLISRYIQMLPASFQAQKVSELFKPIADQFEWRGTVSKTLFCEVARIHGEIGRLNELWEKNQIQDWEFAEELEELFSTAVNIISRNKFQYKETKKASLMCS